ncbi:tRNA (adenosine(37)-N6)-threonylcarbamoyltransferase complex ATPase subunit type 1 TsaE [Pontivivens insulae]|uniref:tRNA threonylcarbamoyladenosine biosynthesis protein TsaE n=1 Tax=Pontivivens insulae TaxID=1639689 RepID=A0A2R8AF76_9RHOB|nr:tRNA (adenosine(37)-N6)-threonylcarbamoyltransferase complex ATPase subunit type 1 TsaE [Pontivivens insulae]RED12090.1 tRNA threonylcarbamoyladenosine biosynthesis protein TsaE [Pontivivens insulae]SPF30846.1 tRNA threonylcarbamoyladenosine biosynthesis protein TsaE [Pontivivens insulae]
MTNPPDVTYELADADATSSVASALAAVLGPGDVVLLNGPVGAGKSHFARAAIRSQTHDGQEVPSPTFTLVQDYTGRNGPIWHMDLYRLGDSGELVELGLDDAMQDAICLIEWPERLGELRPERVLDITLIPHEDAADRRTMVVQAIGPAWTQALKALEDVNVPTG